MGKNLSKIKEKLQKEIESIDKKILQEINKKSIEKIFNKKCYGIRNKWFCGFGGRVLSTEYFAPIGNRFYQFDGLTKDGRLKLVTCKLVDLGWGGVNVTTKKMSIDEFIEKVSPVLKFSGKNEKFKVGDIVLLKHANEKVKEVEWEILKISERKAVVYHWFSGEVKIVDSKNLIHLN